MEHILESGNCINCLRRHPAYLCLDCRIQINPLTGSCQCPEVDITHHDHNRLKLLFSELIKLCIRHDIINPSQIVRHRDYHTGNTTVRMEYPEFILVDPPTDANLMDVHFESSSIHIVLEHWPWLDATFTNNAENNGNNGAETNGNDGHSHPADTNDNLHFRVRDRSRSRHRYLREPTFSEVLGWVYRGEYSLLELSYHLWRAMCGQFRAILNQGEREIEDTENETAAGFNGRRRSRRIRYTIPLRVILSYDRIQGSMLQILCASHLTWDDIVEDLEMDNVDLVWRFYDGCDVQAAARNRFLALYAPAMNDAVGDRLCRCRQCNPEARVEQYLARLPPVNGGEGGDGYLEAWCCICHDTKKEKQVRLVCGHEYHEECICSWLKTKNSCPLCKRVQPICDHK